MRVISERIGEVDGIGTVEAVVFDARGSVVIGGRSFNVADARSVANLLAAAADRSSELERLATVLADPDLARKQAHFDDWAAEKETAIDVRSGTLDAQASALADLAVQLDQRAKELDEREKKLEEREKKLGDATAEPADVLPLDLER